MYMKVVNRPWPLDVDDGGRAREHARAWMSVFVVAADDLVVLVVAIVAAHARGENGPVVVRPGHWFQFMTS